MERRLAAILAADVVGYSRLIRADEEGTLDRLKALRSEIIDPKVAEHNGRIVKLMGDGMLAEFASVVDAVRAAIEAQRSITAHNAGLPEDKRIEFRVGINLGDVVIDGDDIQGDGVNVAARLEGLADPGGICVSGGVYDQVRDRVDAPFEDMGEQKVKNIDRPVRVWRWAADIPTAALRSEKELEPLPLPDKPSIAVLCFDNMSGDPEQDYFAQGIAEDIIAALSRFHWFFVISRNSSFAYKGRAADVKQTARELGVRYVLEGSVRKSGDRVRITAQLIDAIGDRHVWAERFDRVLDDIFAVQDEITQSIVGAVAPEYLTAEMQRVRRKEVPRLDAWELAVRAHWHIAQFTKDDNIEARKLLLKATEIDPESSFGLSDLAFTYMADSVYWGIDLDRSITEAVKTAKRAVAINNRDAYAYALLGAADLYSARHDDAVRSLKQAITVNPNDPHAHAVLGRTMVYLGEIDTALDHVNRAIRLSPRDPLITLWYSILSIAAFVSERYDEAVDWAKASIRAQPNRNTAYLDLAASYAQVGKTKEAAEAFATFQSLTPNASITQIERVHPFKHAADRERYFAALRKAGLSE